MTDFISHPDRWEHEQEARNPLYRGSQPIYSYSTLDDLTQRVWEEVNHIRVAHNHERQVLAFAALVKEVCAWENVNGLRIEQRDRIALSTMVGSYLEGIARDHEHSWGPVNVNLSLTARDAARDWLRFGAGMPSLVFTAL